MFYLPLLETDVWIYISVWSQSMVFKWPSPEILENYGLSKHDKFPRHATGQLSTFFKVDLFFNPKQVRINRKLMLFSFLVCFVLWWWMDDGWKMIDVLENNSILKRSIKNLSLYWIHAFVSSMLQKFTGWLGSEIKLKNCNKMDEFTGFNIFVKIFINLPTTQYQLIPFYGNSCCHERWPHFSLYGTAWGKTLVMHLLVSKATLIGCMS